MNSTVPARARNEAYHSPFSNPNSSSLIKFNPSKNNIQPPSPRREPGAQNNDWSKNEDELPYIDTSAKHLKELSNNNWNSPAAFEKKFDELQYKKVTDGLTPSETEVLEIVEQRLLEFPNPFLPKDHAEGITLKKSFNTLAFKIDRQRREVKK